MRYSISQVQSMTDQEWVQAMVKELNASGYKQRGYNPSIGRWEDDYEPYSANDDTDPSAFVLGHLNRSKEIEYLKQVGLLNNGRCPMCGGVIYGKPARFTSGTDPNFHFQICQSCCSRGRRTSVNPANNSGCGCMTALLLLPIHLIKHMFVNFLG